MKFLIKVFVLFVLCGSCVSCNLVRSVFNMPTSKELKEMRADYARELEEQRSAEAQSQMYIDTLMSADTATNTAMDNIQKVSGEAAENVAGSVAGSAAENVAEDGGDTSLRYYITLGCFKESSNIDNMTRLLKEKGEQPVLFRRNNGSILVCAGGSSSLEEARAALKRIENLAISPEELWIYENKQR